jgi:zinc transport system substrate-binding protein
MRACTVLLSALVLAVCASCGGSEAGGEDAVVAAFYPPAWLAERIAGDEVEVVNLTPPGAEPHDVELSPRDVETLRDAALVVYVGGGFQPAVEDAVEDREGSSLDVLEPGERDPHVWLDPIRFAAVARELGRELGREAAAEAVAAELEQLDASFRRGLASCERHILVTTHAAFGHLAGRYGLTQLALAGSSPESEPGPRELERLVERVRDSGATTVFAEPLVSDRLAETVAREADAEVATLDPLEGLSDERLAAGEDYLSVMRDNVEALREALSCR